MVESVIKQFTDAYVRELDYYKSTSHLCGQQCEAMLASQGIRAIVTYRAKKPQKLLLKLSQRAHNKSYSSLEEVRKDIVDLAGVRIALYFPGDRKRVSTLIDQNFQSLEVKHFPVDGKRRSGKRFEGYYADHHRVRLREVTLSEGQKAYAEAMIEIQVGSVVMHAWAEVEHDLVYKPESGELSEDEHAILDELNGMMIAGEVALERLQRAVERRLSENNLPFENHYELAAFLHKKLRTPALEIEPHLGRIDALFELLRNLGLNSASSLSKLLEASEDLSASDSVSDQIVDLLLAKYPDSYGFYKSFQSSYLTTNFYESKNNEISPDFKVSVGKFFSSWIILERTFALILVRKSKGSILKDLTPNANLAIVGMPKVAKSVNLSDDTVKGILLIRDVRNKLIHGVEVPTQDILESATRSLELIFNELSEHFDELVRSAFTEARAPFEGRDLST